MWIFMCVKNGISHWGVMQAVDIREYDVDKGILA